ncbi:MAG: D-alanyl-D-alanine carboxypeptidase family protein, partial [Actinomycetota bacterium]
MNLSTNRLLLTVLSALVVAAPGGPAAGTSGAGPSRTTSPGPSRSTVLAAVRTTAPGVSPLPVRGVASPRELARPAVSCEACLVVDDRGRVLWSRHPRRRLPNASTTKMATALVVLRDADPSEVVTVSGAAAATGGGGLDLEPGETYTVEALLEAMLLTSSNDAAVALAEHVTGSAGAFVEDMNVLAGRLGARDTHFVTPHGLDVAGHHSSAADLALIARRLLADDLLAEIVATAGTSIEGPRGLIPLENRNPLLEGYGGALGVKTGYTALAGNVLVAAARRGGRTVTTVAMDSIDAAEDSRALLDHGFARLRRT